MQRNLAKFSVGDFQHGYMPAQPVLSCRTVDIDLPGTRTYRQKSTLDILEEHQRLIRNLYKQQRISASAPSNKRTFLSPKPSSEYSNRKVTLASSRASSYEQNFGKVNIEVKGRPLTSEPRFSFGLKDDRTSLTTQRRPKTTDCYMTVRDDKDLLYLSKSNQELNKKLDSYWTSENKLLTTGKFIRGQKRPDDVPPTLDSWLTFAGASKDNSKGVIDAFASFKNSEEYYNIEGSVGSQVARLLQKGDKIRIGVNGILQTQNLKVKTLNKDYISDAKSLIIKRETKQDISKESTKKLHLQGTKLPGKTMIQWTESSKEDKIQETELTRRTENVTVQSNNIPSDDDFEELVISADDFQDNLTKEEMQKPMTPGNPEIHADPVAESQMFKEETITEVLRLSTPLSWNDQCSKSNVKFINANISQKEIPKPVMSETFPIKFEKLINGETRPQPAEVRPDGYKIKQRSAHIYNGSRDSTSKVKVVYIDPLTKEEEEKVNELSVDKIINHSLEMRKKESPAMLLTNGIKDHIDNATNENTEQDTPSQSNRVNSTGSEPRSNRRISFSSSYSDRGSVHSPKLKVTPVHSAANRRVGNLRIVSKDVKNSSTREEVAQTTKSLGKHTSTKYFRRTGIGHGSSIKADVPPSEAEYIKITSQLKIAPGSSPAVSLSHNSTNSTPYQNTPGISTSQDLDYQVVDKIQLQSETPESTTAEVAVSYSRDISPDKKHIPTPVIDSNVDDNYKNERNTREPESPASAIAPISIPTADEESFCNLPSRNVTSYNLTVKESEIQVNEEENIDQNVRQLEEDIADSRVQTFI